MYIYIYIYAFFFLRDSNFIYIEFLLGIFSMYYYFLYFFWTSGSIPFSFLIKPFMCHWFLAVSSLCAAVMCPSYMWFFSFSPELSSSLSRGFSARSVCLTGSCKCCLLPVTHTSITWGITPLSAVGSCCQSPAWKQLTEVFWKRTLHHASSCYPARVRVFSFFPYCLQIL